MQPSPRNETFHTVRDVLEETSRVIEASVAGLLQMAQRDDLSERELLLSRVLAEERAKTGRIVRSVFMSATGSEGQTWLQYTPVFSISPHLAERIAASESAQEAYLVLCNADETFNRALRTIVVARAVSDVLLGQVASLVDQMRRTCQMVYLGADDF
jgi:hypothetical protein